ncbi:MAG TPA: hypothetical protein VFN67_07375 [Polyangiales bacterium]|nr:hypothetical protein [Polyangiales bacterium]
MPIPLARPSGLRADAATHSTPGLLGMRKHCPVCGERYPADFRVCPRDATALATVLGDSDPLIGMVLADLQPLARFIGAESLDPARVELVWLAWGMGVTALLGLIDATTSAIRLSRAGAPLTGTEIVMSTLGSLALLVMPTWLFGHYVSARVWSSTPLVLETARRMRRVLFAGLVTYAAGTLLVRVFAGVLSSDLSAAASAGWGLSTILMGACVGVRTGWRELQRRSAQES